MPEVKRRPAAPRDDALAGWLDEGAGPGVAPGSLERVRALLNSDDRFHGVDRLQGAPPELVGFRDALRAYLSEEDPGALDVLAAGLPLVVGFSPAPRLVPAPGAGPLAAATAELLAVVLDACAAGSWERLKECDNPGCRWVYYDTSRNRSGRWCAMGECGDVMKARAYRERRRSG